MSLPVIELIDGYILTNYILLSMKSFDVVVEELFLQVRSLCLRGFVRGKILVSQLGGLASA